LEAVARPLDMRAFVPMPWEAAMDDLVMVQHGCSGTWFVRDLISCVKITLCSTPTLDTRLEAVPVVSQLTRSSTTDASDNLINGCCLDIAILENGLVGIDKVPEVCESEP
jgi:hypothetical protein